MLQSMDTTEWLNNNNNFSLINWKMGIWKFKGFNEIKYIHACSVESYCLRAWEDPLEKEMASYSSILAWKIPWMEEPAKLPSMGLQRVAHSWATSLHFTSLRDPLDCSPSDSVHGIPYARILQWTATSFSRGFSQPRDQNHVSSISCTGRWILYQCHYLGSP